jgi:hypothetical protein
MSLGYLLPGSLPREESAFERGARSAAEWCENPVFCHPRPRFARIQLLRRGVLLPTSPDTRAPESQRVQSSESTGTVTGRPAGCSGRASTRSAATARPGRPLPCPGRSLRAA